MNLSTDTCISGFGVSCGAEVHLNADCSLEVAEGTLILQNGEIKHIAQKKFRYYLQPDKMDPDLKAFIAAWLRQDNQDPAKVEYLQLADEQEDPANTDSLKQQHPEDIPEQNLMWNKVLVYVSLQSAGDKDTIFWVLISRNILAVAKKFDLSPQSDNQGLFSRSITRKEIDIAAIDQFLRPVLKLPLLTVPRLGYKQLAITQSSLGLKENNLHHPYADVEKDVPPDFLFNAYSQLFFEYKAIIDDYIVVFRNALKLMNELFGPLLSHKGSSYLDNYRKILALKLKRFYEEGEHLYYIQYFYDWLRDLTVAYNEIVLLLDGFRGGCPCTSLKDDELKKGSLLMLGPVLGSRTSYQPLIFRDLAVAAETDRSIRRLRCTYWRMLMMIRTFDLPFLRLEKVLSPDGEAQGIEEELDSTNFWEYLNSATEPHADGEYNWLPIKFTPTRATTEMLGRRAIAYYYPLDGNSIYSVHQFWDYQSTVLRRSDSLLSYNAYEGDPGKPSTDTINDGYSNRPEVLMPLVFDLEQYHWLRPEGHIGKRITVIGPVGELGFYFKSFPLLESIIKYNLHLEVVAVGLPGGVAELNLENIPGLEHRPAMQQGHTLVLFYVDSQTEQIELQECKKDVWPEISQYIVVADFVLPYRYSCCPAGDVTVLPLRTQPLT